MINIFWFRRDLRLDDNAGLYFALKEGIPVLPVFIFDEVILQKLEDKNDARVTFIYDEITRLKGELERTGSSLVIKYGKPENILAEMAVSMKPSSVFANHDYEPYARERDKKVEFMLREKGIKFRTFKDQVIFEKDEVVKDSGDPYTVFTPYSRKWKSLFSESGTGSHSSEDLSGNFHKTAPLPLPYLSSFGFKRSKIEVPSREIAPEVLKDYHLNRDYPARNGTSRLGVHLRFGTISARQVVKAAAGINDIFLNELIWREFYMMILWHFPQVADHSFKPQFDRIAWRNNEKDFEAWCRGETGYPMVDAGMREMNATGFMHNRSRMITASFLAKHLLTDWRWGEAYFARKLLDYELASNNGGWQWAAGTGCDAAPYFRVFNPDLQAVKFDPGNKYIRKWVPEFDSEEYTGRIVNHSEARINAISAYKKALTKNY